MKILLNGLDQARNSIFSRWYRCRPRRVCPKGAAELVLTTISLNKAVILERPENTRDMAFVEARRGGQLRHPPFTPLSGKEF
jgi:hypothetical protein